MSSDFYSSSLSRNLVSTGGLGYRENASLRLLLSAAEENAMRLSPDRDTSSGFVAFPDFGLQTDMVRRTFSAGRISLSKPAFSFGNHPLNGQPSP
ncbi:MAG: hypothetical protein U5L46_10010 [Agrobacterium sp.]|nr:hypothetical protein [Agrobacterium sp.]